MKPLLNIRKASATTEQKALEFNLDPLTYGSIVEIGAGQEVARHFFRAGGASGTIAQSSSAYDMRFSDAIYGPDDTGRYVTKNRLMRMLEREYDLVLERVADTRDPGSRFFAFADTVSAKRFGVDSECHGWMGIRFQHEPRAEPSQVILHIRMLDSTSSAQQSALGALGVNLIDSTFKYIGHSHELVASLPENLAWGRIEIDFIHFEGPAFPGVDNQEMALNLVKSSVSPVIMFDTEGNCVLPSDMMYKKVPLILRGTFRPFTHVHAQMIELGQQALTEEIDLPAERILRFCEMNIARHLYEGIDEISDLGARVQMINTLGYNVMVTSHLRFFRLSEYFLNHAKRRIAFVLSSMDLLSIFDNQYYEGFEGGILEAIAKLFSTDSKLMTYPSLGKDGKISSVDNLKTPVDFHYLYKHLTFNRRILGLDPPPDQLVPYAPQELKRRIHENDPRWKHEVPEKIHSFMDQLVME